MNVDVHITTILLPILPMITSSPTTTIIRLFHHPISIVI
jgi:hypothetical protein